MVLITINFYFKGMKILRLPYAVESCYENASDMTLWHLLFWIRRTFLNFLIMWKCQRLILLLMHLLHLRWVWYSLINDIILDSNSLGHCTIKIYLVNNLIVIIQDTVNHDILLKNYHYGIRGSEHKLLSSYFLRRKQFTKMGSFLSELAYIL